MNTYNANEIATKIENTSLEYAVLSHFKTEEIEDVELRELFQKAKDVFQQIEEKMQPHMYK